MSKLKFGMLFANENPFMSEMINKMLIVDDRVHFINGMTKALKKYRDYNGDIKTVESGKKDTEE